MNLQIGTKVIHTVNNRYAKPPHDGTSRFREYNAKVVHLFEHQVRIEFDNGLTKVVYKTSLRPHEQV